MIFSPVDTNNKSEVEFFEKLYLESFPRNERRPISEELDLIANNEIFSADIILDNEQPVGLLTYWLLDGFVYVEHFAIKPECRSKGYGRIALDNFKNNLSQPIILEVELPDTEIAVKRIKFYESLNFRLWNVDYLQPPYEAEFAPFPLKIMSHGQIDIENQAVYQNVKDNIYKKAYRYFKQI